VLWSLEFDRFVLWCIVGRVCLPVCLTTILSWSLLWHGDRSRLAHRPRPNNSNSNGNGNGNGSATTTPCLFANKEILEKKDSRADSILRTLRDQEKELKSICAETHEVDKKSVQLQRSIESQGLEESLQRAREKGKRLESEVKQEEDIEKTRNAEIQQTRESCGVKGQECTELTKQLAEAKKMNADEEHKLRCQLKVDKTEVEGLLKEKEEKMFQIEEQNRTNEKLSKEIEDYEYYRKSKEEYNTAMAVRSEKKKELLARHNELKRKLQEQEELEKASLIRKKKAEDETNQAQAKKKENSDKETTIVIPGKVEMTRLTEQKMKLAAQIGEASKIFEQEQTAEQEALVAKEDAAREANKLAEKVQAEVRAQQEEIKIVSEKQQECKESHQEQIASHESLREKLSGTYETEMEVYNARYKERHDHLSRKFLQKLEDLKSTYESNKFKMEVFEHGTRLLEDVNKLELESANAD